MPVKYFYLINFEIHRGSAILVNTNNFIVIFIPLTKFTTSTYIKHGDIIWEHNQNENL